MKKLILLLLVVSLWGCYGKATVEDSTTTNKVFYHGHSFVVFGLGDTQWGTHDPDSSNASHEDCPCE